MWDLRPHLLIVAICLRSDRFLSDSLQIDVAHFAFDQFATSREAGTTVEVTGSSSIQSGGITNRCSGIQLSLIPMIGFRTRWRTKKCPNLR